MPIEPGYITEKQAIQARLRRIEGQVRGLQRLVDQATDSDGCGCGGCGCGAADTGSAALEEAGDYQLAPF